MREHRTGGIPNKELAHLQWHNRDAIRPFPIRPVNACGLQLRRDLRRRQRSMDDVVDGSMTEMATLTPAATEAMSGM